MVLYGNRHGSNGRCLVHTLYILHTCIQFYRSSDAYEVEPLYQIQPKGFVKIGFSESNLFVNECSICILDVHLMYHRQPMRIPFQHLPMAELLNPVYLRIFIII